MSVVGWCILFNQFVSSLMPTPTPGHCSVIICHVDMWSRVFISSTPRGLAAAKVGLDRHQLGSDINA